MQFNALNVFHNVNITVSTKKNVLMFYHFNKIMWMGKGHWSTLITQVYLSLKRTHSIFMITSQGQRCMDDFFFFFEMEVYIQTTQRQQTTLPSKSRERNWSDRCECSYWRVQVCNFRTRKLIHQVNTGKQRALTSGDVRRKLQDNDRLNGSDTWQCCAG